MPEPQLDKTLEEFLEIRKLGVDYEEHKKEEEDAVDFDVDLENFKIFPRLDDSVTYKKDALDIRAELKVDPNVDLSDYSGPFKADLRFTDFSKEQLVRMLSMSDEYLILVVEGWAEEVRTRYGDDAMADVQTSAWTNTVLPQVPRILGEFMGATEADAEAVLQGIDIDPAVGMVTWNPFVPEQEWVELGKEVLVQRFLGQHEYFLLFIEAWAAEIVVRYGLDEMFSIQWALWSDKVLPGVKRIKGEWMNITGNDVAAFMKDLQIDSTALPGKAFDLTFEMPEADVGIMTFNRCIAADQWEAMGRPDILQKNCHSTCPASIIETAQMYNPNMKLDILAIPPRVSDENVCCKWKLSMRTEDDPEYVPVTLTTKDDRSPA